MPPPSASDPYPPLYHPRPRTGIPKTIGVLNILFGTLLLLCAFCFGIGLAMQTAMGPKMDGNNMQFQQMQEAERRRQLDELERREQAAANEEEKDKIRAELKAVKELPIVKMPDMSKFLQEPSFQAYGIADVGTGMFLNVLMIAAGIGLVSYRQWGRRLALWVAAMKIIRLIALTAVFVLIVVPNLTRAMTDMFHEIFKEMAKMPQQGQPIPGPAELAKMGSGFSVMYAASSIGMLVLGIIYPIVVLILLSQRRVRAACGGAVVATDEEMGRDDE